MSKRTIAINYDWFSLVWLYKEMHFISAMVILLIHHVSGIERFLCIVLLTHGTLGWHIKMNLFLSNCISFLCCWSHENMKQNLFEVIGRTEIHAKRWTVTWKWHTLLIAYLKFLWNEEMVSDSGDHFSHWIYIVLWRMSVSFLSWIPCLLKPDISCLYNECIIQVWVIRLMLHHFFFFFFSAIFFWCILPSRVCLLLYSHPPLPYPDIKQAGKS